MAIIPQKQLFSWKEIENLGDLDRLRLVLDYLPDEQLMRALAHLLQLALFFRRKSLFLGYYWGFNDSCSQNVVP